MLTIFRKIFLILIILIFQGNSLVFGQPFNNCSEKNIKNEKLKKKKKNGADRYQSKRL